MEHKSKNKYIISSLKFMLWINYKKDEILIKKEIKMIFIGIVTDSKSEKDIEKLLSYNKFLNENNVIFIKDKNIDNIKK